MIMKGKVVSIIYTMYDQNRNIVDTNEGYAPLTYVHGYGHITAEFEKALEGMDVNDQKEILMDTVSTQGGYSCNIKVTSIMNAGIEEKELAIPLITNQGCCGPKGCC